MADSVIIDKALVEDIFKRANEKFFNNTLPTPEFEITNARKVLGQFCKKHRNNYKIKVSQYYKVTLHDVETTIIHEMIHLWQKLTFNHTDHLTTFRQKAREILSKSNGRYNIKRCSSREGFAVAEPTNKVSSRPKNKIYVVYHQTNVPGYDRDTEFGWIVALSPKVYRQLRCSCERHEWKHMYNPNISIVGFVYNHFDPELDKLPALRRMTAIRGIRMKWGEFSDKYGEILMKAEKRLK